MRSSSATATLAEQRADLRQRADYTHKHNVALGRHGWLRLTPAYSMKIVDELLTHAAPADRVLDPFCGTATTALCAASRGHEAVTTELNKFLVWFCKVKTRRYSPAVIAEARAHSQRIGSDVLIGRAKESVPPPIHNVERWWNPPALQFLQRLKGAIDASELDKPIRDLLLVAFCRTLIALSNAAFNHQSMSFRGASTQLSLLENVSDRDRVDGWLRDAAHIIDSAAMNPLGKVAVVQSDARTLEGLSGRGLFDLVITSPPYPNRMSYIRELRPYMYWLGFLTNQKDAGDIDWEAIGGTWGAATSRLKDWTGKTKGFRPGYFADILVAIKAEANASGQLLANYVAKYFEDMFEHVNALSSVLAPGARVHYIVGNSTFYGIVVPVERLYADMFDGLGFRDIKIEAVRKRNSKKELIEFDVSAVWPR